MSEYFFGASELANVVVAFQEGPTRDHVALALADYSARNAACYCARYCPSPITGTMHPRKDGHGAAKLLALAEEQYAADLEAATETMALLACNADLEDDALLARQIEIVTEMIANRVLMCDLQSARA